MTSRAVHQLLHTLSYGDAISGEALALQRCLRELGYESEIFAINVHPHYKKGGSERLGIRDYRAFPTTFDGEAILHYSLGSPLNDLYRSLRRAKRSLIYHNLTPAKWFRGVNPRIVADIEHGMAELPELCRISDRLLADSAFNASELHGFSGSTQVLELPVDPERWVVQRNEGIYSLVKSNPGIHVVHIGRLAPNKCVEDVIKSFYFLHHYIDKRSRLWLSGIDIDTEIYSFALKRLSHELGLDDAITFAGCLADSELKALYEAGSVYCCMSEHEGFCLPVVEAMYFGMPVVAYASSALPATVGKGGVLVTEKRHPEIAELLAEVAKDGALRARLVAAGKERVSALSYENFAVKVRGIFTASSQLLSSTASG